MGTPAQRNADVAAQFEALKRYRIGDGPTCLREQAIVGVSTGVGVTRKSEPNPMGRDEEEPSKKREYAFDNAPRCTATSKRTGQRCNAPAVRGWNVCRFHGARGGAPKGKANSA
jgi:hypothetical protein